MYFAVTHRHHVGPLARDQRYRRCLCCRRSRRWRQSTALSSGLGALARALPRPTPMAFTRGRAGSPMLEATARLRPNLGCLGEAFCSRTVELHSRPAATPPTQPRYLRCQTRSRLKTPRTSKREGLTLAGRGTLPAAAKERAYQVPSTSWQLGGHLIPFTRLREPDRSATPRASNPSVIINSTRP
jgi:hypothetical protein